MGDCKVTFYIKGFIEFVAGLSTLFLAFALLSKPVFRHMDAIDWYMWGLSIGALVSGMTVLLKGLFSYFEARSYNKNQG